MTDTPLNNDFAPEARVARFEQVLRKWLNATWTPKHNSHLLPYWGTNTDFESMLHSVFESIEADLGFRAEVDGNCVRFSKVR